MSSFIRNIQRKIVRTQPDYESSPQPTVAHDDGSYVTLRATRGWIRMSARRLAAQMQMAHLLNPRFIPAAEKREPRDYRGRLSAPGRTAVLRQHVPVKVKRVRKKKDAA